jgi:hypothetical protein
MDARLTEAVHTHITNTKVIDRSEQETEFLATASIGVPCRDALLSRHGDQHQELLAGAVRHQEEVIVMVRSAMTALALFDDQSAVCRR